MKRTGFMLMVGEACGQVSPAIVGLDGFLTGVLHQQNVKTADECIHKHTKAANSFSNAIQAFSTDFEQGVTETGVALLNFAKALRGCRDSFADEEASRLQAILSSPIDITRVAGNYLTNKTEIMHLLSAA